METLVLVLTDVQGSARLWSDEPDAMDAAMRRHHAILHEAIRDHDGIRPPDQGEGDAIFAAFRSPAAAVAAVVQAQRALHAEAWPTTSPLRVRMALHVGEVRVRDGNLFGDPVNRCARIRALASGGQTLLSAALFELVRDRLPPDVNLRDLGEHRMRDLTRPERVYQLDIEGLPRDFPALLPLGRAEGKLPVQLSSFVAREREVKDLLEMTGAHRLVTLIGPAGSGKTRLALEVAAVAGSLPPPVLVDLAVLPPRSDVERSFAVSLGVSADESRLRGSLLELLAGQEHWLLVDNCEHVAESTAQLLADLLTGSAGLRVLATSHAPLGVPGEVVYQVSPLPFPVQSEPPSAIVAAPAIRLFAERAAMAAPGFTVTADNAGDVAAICRCLDGLPLAIELAAARVRVFSPRELLEHLDERFDLLTAGTPTVGRRHLSLEAALRWSYDLLDQDEQLLLERCSVFPAEFAFDVAAPVLAAPPLTPTDVTTLLPRLLDRSLISTIRRGSATTYRLLDSIRQFAADRLATRGELDDVHERHARHHLEYGGSLLADLQGRDQLAAIAWFDRRWEDVRAAMTWALAHEETEMAWRFLAGIGTGWDILGMRGELFDWLAALLEKPLPQGALGVRAAATASFVTWYQDLGRAHRLARVASELARDEDDWHRALATMIAGRAATAAQLSEAAVGDLTAAAAEFGRLGDMWHHAVALAFLSDAIDDAPATIAHLAEAAELFGAHGDQVMRANCLNQMAQSSIDCNVDLDAAAGWLAEAHELAQRTGNLHERLHAELFQTRLDQQRGDVTTTGPRYEDLLVEFRRIGDLRCVSRCLYGLGSTALAAGGRDGARQHLVESVKLADRAGGMTGMAAGLRLLAHIEHDEGRHLDSVRLLGAADVAAERIDAARRSSLPSVVDLRAALEAELSPDTFDSALADGREQPVSRVMQALEHHRPRTAEFPSQ